MRLPRSDLIITAVGGITAAAAVELAVMAALRAPAAIALVLLFPGYALGRALRPRPLGDAAARGIISVSAGLSGLIGGAIITDLVGQELGRRMWALIALVLTIGGVIVAWLRDRDRVTAWLRDRDRVTPSRRGLRRPRPTDVAMLLAASLLMILAFAVGTKPLRPPKGTDGYTELWALRDSRSIDIGVTSYELTTERYRLRLMAGDRVLRDWTLTLRPLERWTTRVNVAQHRLRSSRAEVRLASTGTDVERQRVAVAARGG